MRLLSPPQLFVPCVTTLIFYVVVRYSSYGNEINDVVSPSIFVFLMAYLVSAMFSEIFSMTIDTVLCCYVADEEMFPLEKRFADGGLKSALQRTAQKHASKKAAPAGPQDKYSAPQGPTSDDNYDAVAAKESANAAAAEPQKIAVINVHETHHSHHPEGDVLL